MGTGNINTICIISFCRLWLKERKTERNERGLQAGESKKREDGGEEWKEPRGSMDLFHIITVKKTKTGKEKERSEKKAARKKLAKDSEKKIQQ